MNIRRKIASLLAVTAAASTLVVGFAAPAAHAGSCDIPRTVQPEKPDVSMNEGNDPNTDTYLMFKVNTAGCYHKASVNYTIAEDPTYTPPFRAKSTQPDQDFVAKTSTLSWLEGETAPKYIYVQIRGDVKPEQKESFKLSFTSATGFVQMDVGKVATGHIINDDPWFWQV